MTADTENTEPTTTPEQGTLPFDTSDGEPQPPTPTPEVLDPAPHEPAPTPEAPFPPDIEHALRLIADALEKQNALNNSLYAMLEKVWDRLAAVEKQLRATAALVRKEHTRPLFQQRATAKKPTKKPAKKAKR